MNKNQEMLQSFAKYMMEHPTQRFWQALRNWSDTNFIFMSDATSHEDAKNHLQDTFYRDDASELERIKEYQDACEVQRSHSLSANKAG